MNIFLMCASTKYADGMAAWLTGHIGHVGVVICSPDDESVATAKACAKALGSHIADTRVLDDWKEVERIAQQSTDVLVVTDDPGAAASGWGEDASEILDFAPGAIAMVVTEKGVCWLVTPEIVLADQEIVEAARAVAGSLIEAKGEGPQKRWITSDDPCVVCQENADAGWIDEGDSFPSGDDEPPAHPNCECELETSEGGEDVSESLRESLLPTTQNVETIVRMRLVSNLEDGGTLVEIEPA